MAYNSVVLLFAGFPVVVLMLWHGELDKEIPLIQAQQVAERLVHCEGAYYLDEGHISIIVNHQKEIVKLLSSTQ